MANSHTLGTCSSPRMRWADIEVPNLAVDMNSWARSACYPRSTFYPLSDGPSMRDHRITRPDFRPCSTCGSRSQAGFCPYTRRTISNRAEPTFGRLRYSLGGDRPSQTTRLALSPTRIHGPGLEPQYMKGGISRLSPPKLTPRLPRLPPILHSIYRNPTSNCSKGPRGLSVLLRVTSIFTRRAISPGLWLRQ